MNIIAAFPANAETAELMQPRQRALHHPAGLSQATAIGGVTASKQRTNLSFAQPAAVRLGIIAPIPLHHFGPTPGPSPLPSHRRNRLDQRLELGDIRDIGPCQAHREREAIGIRDDMVFAARLGSVRGIRACLRPPKTARTLALSTTARDQSIASASCSRASSTSRSFSQTPAACHSASRRQQVIPQPQPISWGSISQGMPERSTNRIPVSAGRFGTGGRPPLSLGFSGGKSGSMGWCRPMSYVAASYYSIPRSQKVMLSDVPCHG